MKERVPAEIFPPGEFIKEEIEARGWTQDDLADILGRPVSRINEIISGKRGITPETAKGLGEAFGTGGQFWMNLETAYRLSRLQVGADSITRRATIYSKAPVRAMIKRHWIEPSDNIDVIEKRVAEFFLLKELGDEPQLWASARKSTSYGDFTPAQIAWLFRAKHLAGAVSATHFTESNFKKALEGLRLLLLNPEDVKKVPEVLAENGIKFLIAEPLPQTHIDGACFWEENTPVIVLSLRYDRIDWFWFTLFHELGHIKNKDGYNNENYPLDCDLVGDQSIDSENKPNYEKAADKFASDFLIPQNRLEDFISRIRPLYSKKRIQGFAAVMQVHPGIVVGQLQHKKEISYAQNREMLAKVRELITNAALTDGWGFSLPATL